jgi:hypothetical protein
MAHPNIEERRELVGRLVHRGFRMRGRLRRAIARRFGCSPYAVYADQVALTRPSTDETPHVGPRMRAAIYARDGRVCQYCGDEHARTYIVEHVIPAALGGVARPHNLVVACQSCNVTKRQDVWVPRNLEAITAGRPASMNDVLHHSKTDQAGGTRSPP